MGNRNTLERTRVWGQGGAGVWLLRTHLSIRACFLEHPVDREEARISASLQGKAPPQAIPWQDRGQVPGLISRHRPSLVSQSSVWYNQILPSPARPHPSPIIANIPLVGSAMGPSASSSHSRLTVSKDRSGPAAHLLNPPSSRRRKALCVWSALPPLPLDIASHSPHPSSHSASLLFLQHTRVGPASGPLLEQYLPQDAPHPRSAGPAPCLL